MKNNILRLPLRTIIPAQTDPFDDLYKMKSKKKVGKDLLKIFYFTNDDYMIFGEAPADFNLTEQVYRNNLRQKISEYFEFGFKVREWEMLMHSVYKYRNPNDVDDKIFLDGSFYGRKIIRYKVFAKNICDFCLSMIHATYWEDFRNLVPTEKTLRMCIEEVFPFVEKVKDMFEKELEEEFDTSDIEKELGIGKENKKLSITSSVEMPLKVSKK